MHTGLSGIGYDPILHPFLLPRALEESRSNSARREPKTARLHHNWPLNKLDHKADWQPKAAGFSRKEKPTPTSSKLLRQSFLKLTPTKSTSLTEFCLLNSLLSPEFLHQPVPHHSFQCSISTMGLIEPNHLTPSVQGSSLQDPNQSQQACRFAAVTPSLYLSFLLLIWSAFHNCLLQFILNALHWILALVITQIIHQSPT